MFEGIYIFLKSILVGALFLLLFFGSFFLALAVLYYISVFFSFLGSLFIIVI